LILISIFLSCDSDSTVWDEGSQSTDDYKTDCILLLISFILLEYIKSKSIPRYLHSMKQEPSTESHGRLW